MTKEAKPPTKQIGVRMSLDMVDQIDRLAGAHHRDRSDEVIHACSLYIAAHEPPNTPEGYYAALQALEAIKSKMLGDLERMGENTGNRSGWIKVEEGWLK